MDYFLDCLFTKAYSEGKNLIIEGYASTEDVDSVGDVVLTSSAKNAIEKMMITYMKNPVLLFQHGKDKDFGYKSIGHIEDYRIDSKGLWVKAVLSSSEDVKPIVTRIVEKDLRGFSIGFVKKKAMKLKDGTTVITDYQLKEISIVSIPCNENTLFNVVKNLEINENEIKNQEEIKTMAEFNEELQKKYFDLYTLHADTKAEKALLEREKKHLEEQLEKKAYENEEHKNDIEKTIKCWTEEKETLETKLEDLEKSLNEFKEKGLNITPNAPSTKESEVVIKAFENAVYDIERTPYYEMEKAFIDKMTEVKNKSRFEYNKEMVIKSYMTDLGIEFDANNVKHKELVEKAIASTASINRESTVQFTPLGMADSRTPLLAIIPKVKRDSKNFKWYQQTALPTAVHAAEGFTPTLSEGTYGTKNDDLKIQYCGSTVNDFAEKVAGTSMVALESKAIDHSLDINTHWTLLHGNESADSYAFDGILYYVNTSTGQFVDKNGTVITLDIIDDLIGSFMENMAGKSTDGKRPNAIAVDTRMYTKLKKLHRALYAGSVAPSSVITINGLKYNMFEYDGIMIVECDDLRDYSHTAPTFSASAVAGGALADDEYFFRVSAVTANGESTAGTETSATTSAANNTVRLAVTKQTGVLYYKIYYGLTTGHTNLTWIQTTERSTGAGTQNIDITATPTAKYEKCLDDANNSKIVAMKIGGEMGAEYEYNEMKTFVKLAKTGDNERFYKRNYHGMVLKNEYAVTEYLVDLA